MPLNVKITKDEIQDTSAEILTGSTGNVEFTYDDAANKLTASVEIPPVDLSNYYNKQEVYNKNEVDTKGEVDSKIAAIPKVDLTPYYQKVEVYNKVEVDSKISSVNTEKSIADRAFQDRGSYSRGLPHPLYYIANASDFTEFPDNINLAQEGGNPYYLTQIKPSNVYQPELDNYIIYFKTGNYQSGIAFIGQHVYYKDLFPGGQYNHTNTIFYQTYPREFDEKFVYNVSLNNASSEKGYESELNLSQARVFFDSITTQNIDAYNYINGSTYLTTSGENTISAVVNESTITVDKDKIFIDAAEVSIPKYDQKIAAISAGGGGVESIADKLFGGTMRPLPIKALFYINKSLSSSWNGTYPTYVSSDATISGDTTKGWVFENVEYAGESEADEPIYILYDSAPVLLSPQFFGGPIEKYSDILDFNDDIDYKKSWWYTNENFTDDEYYNEYYKVLFRGILQVNNYHYTVTTTADKSSDNSLDLSSFSVNTRKMEISRSANASDSETVLNVQGNSRFYSDRYEIVANGSRLDIDKNNFSVNTYGGGQVTGTISISGNSILIDAANVSIPKYDQKIAAMSGGSGGTVDLSNYYNKSETDTKINENAFTNEKVAFFFLLNSDAASDVGFTYFNNKVGLFIQNNVVTEAKLSEGVRAKLNSSGGSVDLSNYYTKVEVDNKTEKQYYLFPNNQMQPYQQSVILTNVAGGFTRYIAPGNSSTVTDPHGFYTSGGVNLNLQAGKRYSYTLTMRFITDGGTYTGGISFGLTSTPESDNDLEIANKNWFQLANGKSETLVFSDIIQGGFSHKIGFRLDGTADKLQWRYSLKIHEI
ncbi:hypothetical protein MUN82_01950 [Hymenobacter aerilatus]|uniref:Uncharacterized protein n=1 Tax=Hymenobacter aerilatus TaxID=2932251 RepID=A0A8T9SY75_9BACT|nr:hypothetical protein [Hymenobacter aerilatus]UOR05874.1 hypothetical protein MUN82_01950 [Hymenobacter aerilatus]